MPPKVLKPITKKYLMDRCSFKGQTVIKAVKDDGLWAIVEQLDPKDQLSIFKVVDKEVNPLTENQIDSLFAYLSNEIREPLDLISMSKTEKLDVVRENSDELDQIISKKGFSERIKLNSKITVPREEYSASKLWNIIKSGKYQFE